MDAALYELFWENSKLGPLTVRKFRRRIEEYEATEEEPNELHYSSSPVELRRPRDLLNRLMDMRRSERAFSEQPLPARRLGSLFAAFGTAPDGSRPFASAGATYPLEIFALLPNVAGVLGGKAVHFDAASHALTAVADLPPWDTCRGALNLEGISGTPHVVVVFVLLPERMTGKYGERGGRFALIEVGHAAQNLALRLAWTGMAGCELGGLLDERVKEILGLRGTGAQIALGYACGLRGERRQSGLLGRGRRAWERMAVVTRSARDADRRGRLPHGRGAVSDRH